MNLKRFLPLVALAGILSWSGVSCASKVSDPELQTKVETKLSGNPDVSVLVKDGVVTLNGTVSTEAEKASLAESAKQADAKHIKSVVNNLMVESAPVITISPDSELVAKVVDATKDFPTVNATVNAGVIVVTGTLEQARVQTLKMGLDALNPKKVDMTGLTVK